MIDNLTLADISQLENKSLFPLPDLNHPSFVVKKAIVEDGELRGMFYAKVTSEVSLVLDPSLSNFQRAKSIREMFSYLLKELNNLGIRDAYAFLDCKEEFGHFLKKNFGFTEDTRKVFRYGD